MKGQLATHLAKNNALLLVLSLASSCGPSISEVENIEEQLIQNPLTNIPCVKEFHTICPDAPIRLYFDHAKRNSVTIQATDIIYDRYNLTLSIEVKTDSRKQTITSFENPLIMFIEITSVAGDSDGSIKSSYGDNFKISPNQWQKVIEAGGQFSAAGIEVKKNEPVAGIEELKTYLRRTGIE